MLILRCKIIALIHSLNKLTKMSTIPKKRGRKPLPFSAKLLQVWTSLPAAHIVKIEDAGYNMVDFLAAASTEKMQRDGLLQQ